MNIKALSLSIGALALSSYLTNVYAQESTLDDTLSGAKKTCAQYALDPDADLGEVLHAGCQPTTAQMSALMDNPVGNVALWWNQYDSYRLRNDATDKEATQGNYMGILQFPKGLNEDWNLISRVIYNVASSPLDQNKIDRLGSSVTQPPNGGATAPALLDVIQGRTTGFGDTYYVGLFSPKEPIEIGTGKLVWGAGFDLGAPTASEDVLGTNKWTGGPSALGVYLGEKWKFGALLQQYWDFGSDFGGKSEADSVNMTNLQYFYYYSLSDTMSVGAGPNIIIDWEQDGSQKYTVPVGLGINKTIKLGKVPIRLGAEYMYTAVQPDEIPSTDWSIRFFAIIAVPSAMFGWMK